jgi:hypothetical protein
MLIVIGLDFALTIPLQEDASPGGLPMSTAEAVERDLTSV